MTSNWRSGCGGFDFIEEMICIGGGECGFGCNEGGFRWFEFGGFGKVGVNGGANSVISFLKIGKKNSKCIRLD